ncbi:EamA family transporter RarD [bacterium]|nr:EamA family transporter RarD [bacterium]
MTNNLVNGILAFVLWGLFPIYWRALQAVSAPEILAYRIVGSLFFVAFLLVIMNKWSWLKELTFKKFSYYGLTSLFISTNWLVYIWAVNNDQVVEASLGYYINPLMNVLLGTLFLNEKLRKMQKIAILIAMMGVAFLTYKYGKLPWVSLILATSFAIYGLLKKKSDLGGVESFSLETFILSFPAFGFILFLIQKGESSWGNLGVQSDLLLLGAGIATGLPLVLYNLAAKKLTLTTLGMLQYISPTFQLLIGLLVFKEAFPLDKLLGFAIIWLALIIYTGELVHFNNRKRVNFR